MRNFFVYNLVYGFHRLGFCFYSVKYYYQDYSKNRNKFICFFKAIGNGIKIFFHKYGYYEYLEIPITTRCSLKCKHCSNLIPCYKNPSDYDVQILISSIKAFLDCIENIVYVRVLGGEPFLSKNLYRVINVLLKSSKIQRVEIVTNGTIIPRDKKLLRIMRNSRIIVCISQYPMINYPKLVEFLKKENINYRVDKMNFWMDYGGVEKRGKTNRELMRQFSRCHHVCKSLVNGQLHFCPRSSHGTDLGIIKNNESDYVDLLDDSISLSEKKKSINRLFKKKCIIACDYCDFGTKKSKKVPVAEQINYREKK